MAYIFRWLRKAKAAKMPKGEKPKSKIIKLAEGNRSNVGLHRIYDEPQGLGHPRMPPGLNELAEEMWLDTVSSLPDGVLTRADEAALEAYAVNWSVFRQAREKLDKTGLLVVMNNAVKAMMSTGSELGLTPAGRARLAHPEKWDSDPITLLLGE
ncbi:P27 family phage terminase small subunit [Sinorhizobium medicae]|uniref:P27 family phage terminase small subunit n=1 Tax=Sinorhizobium medicae TaxID=110321 RepID=UPI0003A4DA9A|nr:P27 family phage terminase small subunit [Sinorhizobium medicae]